MHADPSASADEIPDEGDSSVPALPTLAQIERSVIEYRLGLFEGNKSAVARSCGVSRAMLYDRMREWRREARAGRNG